MPTLNVAQPQTEGPFLDASLAACEDADLIQLALAGRGDCFSLLMDRHLSVIKNRVRTLVSNEADLDDLVQEILFKVWRHLAHFRAESSLRTWMTRVAINEALQSWRRERSRPLYRPLEDSPEPLSSMESPDRSVLSAETNAAVLGAIAGLPKKYREVVVLRHLRELSLEQAAECLEISTPAMKSRLFRARQMLSRKLRRLGRSPRRCVTH
jgi:RNA polymerase sigma factor (sigma-70 family)